MFFRLSANCPQCDKGLINPSVPLVMTGLCLTCPLDNANIRYSWEIFYVAVDDSKFVAKEECKPALEDSEQSNTLFNLGVSSISKPSAGITTTPEKLIVAKRPTNGSVTPKTGKADNTQNARVIFASGSICRDPGQMVGPTSGPSSTSSSTTSHPSGFPGSGSGDGGSGSGDEDGHGVGSGSGNGTGTGSGTGSGSGTDKSIGGSSNIGTASATGQHLTTWSPWADDSGDDEPADIYDPQYTPPSSKHSGSIITLKRRRLRLLESYTTTGLNSQNFVLLDKFGYFAGGRTYMVAFKVDDGRTGQKGKATIYFNTSGIPECGVCTVKPSAGVAMETTFQLTCSKWKAGVRR